LRNHVEQALSTRLFYFFSDALRRQAQARGYPATEPAKTATIKSPNVIGTLPNEKIARHKLH